MVICIKISVISSQFIFIQYPIHPILDKITILEGEGYMDLKKIFPNLNSEDTSVTVSSSVVLLPAIVFGSTLPGKLEITIITIEISILDVYVCISET